MASTHNFKLIDKTSKEILHTHENESCYANIRYYKLANTLISFYIYKNKSYCFSKELIEKYIQFLNELNICSIEIQETENTYEFIIDSEICGSKNVILIMSMLIRPVASSELHTVPKGVFDLKERYPYLDNWTILNLARYDPYINIENTNHWVSEDYTYRKFTSLKQFLKVKDKLAIDYKDYFNSHEIGGSVAFYTRGRELTDNEFKDLQNEDIRLLIGRGEEIEKVLNLLGPEEEQENDEI
jgi:hypothetical protein